ncbi:MAG: hypothetical protein AB1540_08040, partial [Bdellovibrionota bacterium]
MTSILQRALNMPVPAPSDIAFLRAYNLEPAEFNAFSSYWKAMSPDERRLTLWVALADDLPDAIRETEGLPYHRGIKLKHPSELAEAAARTTGAPEAKALALRQGNDPALSQALTTTATTHSAGIHRLVDEIGLPKPHLFRADSLKMIEERAEIISLTDFIEYAATAVQGTLPPPETTTALLNAVNAVAKKSKYPISEETFGILQDLLRDHFKEPVADTADDAFKFIPLKFRQQNRVPFALSFNDRRNDAPLTKCISYGTASGGVIGFCVGGPVGAALGSMPGYLGGLVGA